MFKRCQERKLCHEYNTAISTEWFFFPVEKETCLYKCQAQQPLTLQLLLCFTFCSIRIGLSCKLHLPSNSSNLWSGSILFSQREGTEQCKLLSSEEIKFREIIVYGFHFTVRKILSCLIFQSKCLECMSLNTRSFKGRNLGCLKRGTISCRLTLCIEFLFAGPAFSTLFYPCEAPVKMLWSVRPSESFQQLNNSLTNFRKS